jgi:hypothetical protein
MKLKDKELDAALKQKDCSEELVLWVLEHGSLAQQVLFLFDAERSSEIVERFRGSQHPKLIAELIERDDASYLAWALDLGFEIPNFAEMEADEAGLGMRWQIDNWVDEVAGKLEELYESLVPKEGSANTLQGELVRAISRIRNEHARNGMTNWGDGYYEHLTNLIQSTLKGDVEFSAWVKKVLEADIDQVFQSGIAGLAIANGKKPHRAAFHPNFLVASDVEKAHQRLCAEIAIWCERQLLPIPYEDVSETKPILSRDDF